MKTTVCFGELLLRFSPHLGGEWIRQHHMPVFVGGAELNVATALAKWNLPVDYCTVLPDHALSKEIIASIEDRGIGTQKIRLAGNRIGTYYLPQGADLKNAGVIYDRAHSSFWDLQPRQIDWDRALQDVSWFHFSAISPALNDRVAAVCLEAAKAATAKGITVSIDLNYRSKLWQWGKQPVAVMPELVSYCDVVMGNIWAAEKMLGIPFAPGFNSTKENCLRQSQQTAEQVLGQFSRCRQVAHTFRFDEGDGVRYYATLFDGKSQVVSAEQATPFVVDKVGSGDTFMAGLIFGNRQALTPQETIDFAAAAAFSKLFIKGDATTATVDQIRKNTQHHG